MTPEEIEKLTESMKVHVEASIRKAVNRELVGVRKEMEDLSKQGEALSKQVQPAVDLVTSLQGFNKVTLYFLVLIGTIIGILAGLATIVYGFLKIKRI